MNTSPESNRLMIEETYLASLDPRVWAIAASRHRAGALRAEPQDASQAKPLIAYRKGDEA